MKNKFKINCSRFALNVFAQLPPLVPALLLVVYKSSKRKRAVGDVFNTNRVVRNYPEKVLCTLVITHDNRAPRWNLKLRIFMTSISHEDGDDNSQELLEFVVITHDKFSHHSWKAYCLFEFLRLEFSKFCSKNFFDV